LAVVAALALGLYGCAAGATEPRQDALVLAATEVFVLRDAWSGYPHEKLAVITDAHAWADEWAMIHAHVLPSPPLPTIDFAGTVLVLAAAGPRPTTGYSFTIEEVRAVNGSLEVDVRELAPGPGCVTGQAFTSPVHVVQVPRTGTTATFTVRRSSYPC
jgi:hypothetical protein